MLLRQILSNKTTTGASASRSGARRVSAFLSSAKAMSRRSAGLSGCRYEELRRLAGRRMRRGKMDTVSPTGLPHETYLRMREEQAPDWQDRNHCGRGE